MSVYWIKKPLKMIQIKLSEVKIRNKVSAFIRGDSIENHMNEHEIPRQL